MDRNALNTYKWLDAQEVRPKSSNFDSSAVKLESAFSKRVLSKVFDFLDMV